ncbi:MAG: hypothetical protein ACPLYD_15885 [Anaerolineae bacterium]
MKRIVYASFILDSKKPFAEIEKDRGWVLKILKRMKIRKFRTAPFGFDFKLEVNSQAFELWLQALQERPDLAPSHIRVERIYTDQDLSSAHLLEWGPTNQAIEDDYYDLHFYKHELPEGTTFVMRYCDVCRAPLEQIRDFLLDTHKMGKRDLSLTYGFEVILSSRLARMLQESGFTGFTLRPVWDYRKPYQGEPKLYQLVVTHILPPMASPPTEFEQEQRCETCGTVSKFLKHTHFWGSIQYYEETDIYYIREVLEQAADFNATYERIGMLSASHPLLIISQRVHRWLKEQGIKGWSTRPIYLVEPGTLKSE